MKIRFPMRRLLLAALAASSLGAFQEGSSGGEVDTGQLLDAGELQVTLDVRTLGLLSPGML